MENVKLLEKRVKALEVERESLLSKLKSLEMSFNKIETIVKSGLVTPSRRTPLVSTPPRNNKAEFTQSVKSVANESLGNDIRSQRNTDLQEDAPTPKKEEITNVLLGTFPPWSYQTP